MIHKLGVYPYVWGTLRWQAGYKKVKAIAQPYEAETFVLHELRSPLGVIATAARLLADGDEADIQRQATIIHRNAERMMRIASTVLDTVRALQSQQSNWYSPVQVLTELVFDLQLRGIDVRWPLGEAPVKSQQVFGCVSQWEALLHSIFVNALDHSPQGSAIRVGTRLDATKLTVGIENDVAAGLPHAGLGLGLRLAEALVRALEADWAIEQEGSRFKVVLSLPIAEANFARYS